LRVELNYLFKSSDRWSSAWLRFEPLSVDRFSRAARLTLKDLDSRRNGIDNEAGAPI